MTQYDIRFTNTCGAVWFMFCSNIQGDTTRNQAGEWRNISVTQWKSADGGSERDADECAGKTLTVQAVVKDVVRQRAAVQPLMLPMVAVRLNCAELAGCAQVRNNYHGGVHVRSNLQDASPTRQ